MFDPLTDELLRDEPAALAAYLTEAGYADASASLTARVQHS